MRVVMIVSLLLAIGCGGGPRQVAPLIQNALPAIASLAMNVESIKVNDPRAIQCTASDPDNDPLTFRWSATGGSISGAGDSVTWLAPSSRGLYTIRCTVSDGRGGETSDELVVEVSGWEMLYVHNDSVAVLTLPGGAYSHYKAIGFWEDAGYSVTVMNVGAVEFTDSLLADYDVVYLRGWVHAATDAEGFAIHSWVNGGGSLLTVVSADPMVPSVAPFGVDRIEGSHGGSSGLNWSFYGAPLRIGPVGGPEAGVSSLAVESMDRPYLTNGHSLTIAATHGGYPAVVYGEFGFGAVVIVFAQGWLHDATKPGNAYRSNIDQGDNTEFLKNSISYLS